MPDYSHIAWTDIETTGLDPVENDPLEIAIILTDLDLVVIDERSWLIQPPSLDILGLNPVVRKMHNENGLIRDLMDAQEESMAAVLSPRSEHEQREFLTGASSVDLRITRWLRATITPDSWHDSEQCLALGGSGVSHFDARWLPIYFPYFEKWLHRSTLDVGVMRRFIENVVKRPKLVPRATRDLPHRALDDAHLHLREARRYRDLIKRA